MNFMEPMKLLNIQSVLMRIFNGVFILVFGYIIFNIVAQPSVLWGLFKPITLIIGSLIFIGLFLMINHWLLKMSQKTLVRLTFLNFIILFLLQVFFFRYFRVIPSWDFGAILNFASSTVESTGDFVLDRYFYFKYPNNIPIYLIYVGMIEFLNSINVTDCLSIFIMLNIILVSLSCVLTYYFIYLRYGLQQATLFSFLMIFITPFYTYTTIVYTDTLVMIFPILSILIYFLFDQSKGFKRYVWLLLLGVILAIGTIIKTNVIITLVAVLIHYFMTNKGWNVLISIIVLVLPFYSVTSIYQQEISQYSPISQEEMGFPATHWILMGLHDQPQRPGSYYADDVKQTEELKRSGLTNQELSKWHLEAIKERLEDYGVHGYLRFLSRKINFTWGDGTYYATNKLSRHPMEDNIFQPYVFGEKSKPFVIACQIIQVAILGLVLVAGISLFKSSHKFEQVLTILLFGLFLFLLIWEARSRYLVLYVPVIATLGIYGLNQLNSYLKKVKVYYRNLINKKYGFEEN